MALISRTWTFHHHSFTNIHVGVFILYCNLTPMRLIYSVIQGSFSKHAPKLLNKIRCLPIKLPLDPPLYLHHPLCSHPIGISPLICIGNYFTSDRKPLLMHKHLIVASQQTSMTLLWFQLTLLALLFLFVIWCYLY